ncbi:hypothetical protein JCM12294_33400 [Desulfocicer niacini]
MSLFPNGGEVFPPRLGHKGINSLIQTAKAKARRYRSSRNYITMIYLIAGKLDYTLPT